MIDIVVVNWNSGSQLACCLDSIKMEANYFPHSIFVIDNGSVDGSASMLAGDPSIACTFAGINLGFGKACNIGASQGCGEFLLFLNPDAALRPGTLAASIAFMRNPANARAGICGVQLMDETHQVSRSCSRFPSLAGFVMQALGLTYVFPRLGHRMAEWAHDRTQEVDQVIGAYFLVRRALFEELDGFDERFFVYFEEVDFSYRARQAGWRSVYLADVQAFHAGGGTSHQVKAKRLFYSLRSRLLYAFKHFSFASALMVLVTTMLLEPLSRTALAIAKRSWPALKETWSGYLMLWRWLPQWLIHNKAR